MCIRDSAHFGATLSSDVTLNGLVYRDTDADHTNNLTLSGCLLYTSDAADERSSVDLGGRRFIKKNKKKIQQKKKK